MKLRGKSEGFIVPSAPDGQHNRWGGKEPCSRRVSTREGLGDWREPGNSGHDPDTPEALGINAKQAPAYRFYLLDDKGPQADIRAHAYTLAKQHDGTSGVGGQTSRILIPGLFHLMARRESV